MTVPKYLIHRYGPQNRDVIRCPRVVSITCLLLYTRNIYVSMEKVNESENPVFGSLTMLRLKSCTHFFSIRTYLPSQPSLKFTITTPNRIYLESIFLQYLVFRLDRLDQIVCIILFCSQVVMLIFLTYGEQNQDHTCKLFICVFV